MMQPRCAVCDGDNDVMTLCDLHAPLVRIKRDVLTGDLTDWEPLTIDKHPMRINHAAMLLTKDERNAASRPLRWRISVLSACNGRGVWWDDGSGDTRDTETDRYVALFGIVPDWVLAEVETVARQARARREGKGRVA